MEIQEFMTHARESLRKFDKFYREAQKDSPEDFPKEYDFGEWFGLYEDFVK